MAASSGGAPSSPFAKPGKRSRKVAYCFDADAASHDFGMGHAMKPHRVRLADTLIRAYGVNRSMLTWTPTKASDEDLEAFHDHDMVRFLKDIRPETLGLRMGEAERFGLGSEDCPVFEGLFGFNQCAAGASIGGAAVLNDTEADIVINWQGGFHHAHKARASGFCYVNDCVLAIIELLKVHQRVLYVDIDIHHGDGVERAFLDTDRVMTLSLHHYDRPAGSADHFFPGTGHWSAPAIPGKHVYALNAPLPSGTGDGPFLALFKLLVDATVERFRPDALVLQCGADSVAGDLLGQFNVSSDGHAACVDHACRLGIPTLVLGGGGYTMANVARVWAYETAVIAGVEVDAGAALPVTEARLYFAEDATLRVPAADLVAGPKRDRAVATFVDKMGAILLERLRQLPAAPSVGVSASADGHGQTPLRGIGSLGKAGAAAAGSS